jgi:hypothetical protein
MSCRPQTDGGFPMVFVNAADTLVGYITTSSTTTSYATIRRAARMTFSRP